MTKKKTYQLIRKYCYNLIRRVMFFDYIYLLFFLLSVHIPNTPCGMGIGVLMLFLFFSLNMSTRK